MRRDEPGIAALPAILLTAIDELSEAATAVAAGIVTRASAATSPGRERAVLRLLGVTGLDREGRPLAAEVVERMAAGRGDGLASGVALPFAMALDEYETTPQQLALDVAAGAVDLVAEGRLLERPGARQRAETRLAALVGLAGERIDANRVARTELLRLLGEAPRPWIGVDIRATDVAAAIVEAAGRCRAGADLLRVEVPAGRELAERLGGGDRPTSTDASPGWAPGDVDPAPPGSQRGLARLRDALDRAAVERGAYVRLSIAPPALAAPEGALVAAFERADLVELDPVADIVAVGIDPDRAFADFAAAIAITGRAGVPIALGAGPLAVGPELSAGIPADPSTRSGRALGLQVLAARVAAGLGSAAGSILVGGIPSWTASEPDGAARAAGGLGLRMRLFPDAELVLRDPGGEASVKWGAIVGALAPSGRTALIHLAADPAFAAAASAHRAAATVAAELVGRAERGGLDGLALKHAEAVVRAARATVARVGAEGWGWLIGLGRDRSGDLAAGSATARLGPPDATTPFLG